MQDSSAFSLHGARDCRRFSLRIFAKPVFSAYPLPRGRVPKWTKGTDCKSVIRGFESHLGLCARRRIWNASFVDLARSAAKPMAVPRDDSISQFFKLPDARHPIQFAQQSP